ncbi:sensor histidine kinase [Lactococcus formosensis]|jgi:Signal transduction histidine kinase|uniref:histidine kinase n=1 Tax=Lactococcus formosensis TaxID=1281486 RepID=A0A9Q8Y300_9LACT|nr:sensor histidine kinase [Lactococcus formosensis]NHI72944.1 HAMP domain-containing histidine kinase [Lactococcus garvieae]MCO7179574.1 sensor histidine kinase [Lactococcus formosensis]MDG6119294.1 sensor histidine kinase [Lactococcus formosensis]NHI99320.1 HAMP domain-containing histidine kinase [Lactococcus garvieae]NHJ17457.1 HAMP domain-containing histidine kinase [Lactococcus garvieae]
MPWSKIKRFLQTKIAQIGVFLVMLFIFVSNFLLWHLPIESLINATILALIVFVIYLVSSYFRWANREAILCDLKHELWDLEENLRAKEKHIKETEDIIKVWSHQMKIPLAAIDLMAQTEINPIELKNQTFALDNYLKMLLEYQRISNISTDFHFEKFSVAQLLRELLKKYSSFFIQKNLSVTISGDWEITTDRKWFSLAIEQLLNNAIKYTDEGSLTISIEEDKIVLSDTGIGILPEDLPRIFEHGFTGYNGRGHYKASGLGLYLTKLILDRLDFSIKISSELGVGTSVEVEKNE